VGLAIAHFRYDYTWCVTQRMREDLGPTMISPGFALTIEQTIL